MSLKVLVVDDSSVMRSIIIKTLRLSGIGLDAVLVAGNGAEALEVLQHNPVDLAIVDINMPVMNGEEFIGRVRSAPDMARIKVVVVSSDHTDARMERLRAQDVPIVHKPFNPSVLKDTILMVTGETADDGPAEDGAF